jgi:purine-binding chemotaxis protein CheW
MEQGISQSTEATNVTGFTPDGNQYLSFTLGNEEYGLDILKVQEIKGYSAITPIPRAAPYIKGMMNLRGTIVPIVDLRIRFNMPQIEYDQFTVIIVIMVENRTMGMVVDAVSDVLNIQEEDIQSTVDFSDNIDTSFISGMGKAGDRMVIMLDVHKILGIDELQTLAK